MPSYNDYMGMQRDYSSANPIEEGLGQYGYNGGNLENEAGSTNQNLTQIASQKQYVGFLNTLSPAQQAEYQRLADEEWAKTQRRDRMIGAGAVGGVAGLGALYGGAGALGGAGGAAESFPVYGGSAEFTNLPELMGGAGATTSPVYSGAMPEFTNLNLETGLPESGGAKFGSQEQRASDYAGGYGSTDGVTPATAVNGGGNPILDSIKQALGMSGKGPLGQVSQGVKLGSNLLDMYNTYTNKKRNQGFINGLNSLYGPNSAYAGQLDKALSRSYAASGRRSDVGGRNVELQAKLAEMNGRLAPTLNEANNQQSMYQNRFLKSGISLADQSGWLDKGLTSLSKLFGG